MSADTFGAHKSEYLMLLDMDMGHEIDSSRNIQRRAYQLRMKIEVEH